MERNRQTLMARMPQREHDCGDGRIGLHSRQVSIPGGIRIAINTPQIAIPRNQKMNVLQITKKLHGVSL